MQSFKAMQQCELSTKNTGFLQLPAVPVDTKLMLLALMKR